MNDVTYRQLKEIEYMDPDGWETEPKAEDYGRFVTWAITQYGKETYDVYKRGNWDVPDV